MVIYYDLNLLFAKFKILSNFDQFRENKKENFVPDEAKLEHVVLRL
jgi:hypothetical protein